MAIFENIKRWLRTPATGENAGKKAVEDANLVVKDRLVIPVSDENTLNGGNDENGPIKLSRNEDGDLVLNSYADGKWTEYIAVLDGLKLIGGIDLEGNELTIVAPVKWRIDGSIYSKSTDTLFTIPFAADGFKRIDLIYADKNNNILKLQGEATEGIAIQPTLPINTVSVTLVYVDGNSISPPAPDLSNYLTSNQADTRYIQASPFIPQDASINMLGDINMGRSLNMASILDIELDGFGQGANININNSVSGFINLLGYFINLKGAFGEIRVTGQDIIRLQDNKKVLFEGDAQAPLVSGTNIKTINGVNILGSGNVDISGEGGNAQWGSIGGNIEDQTDLITILNRKDAELGYYVGSNWIIFGDSITFGTAATDPSLNWVSLVMKGLGATFTNNGIPSTTLQLATPYEANTFFERYTSIGVMQTNDYLSIAYGVNDISRNGTYSAQNYYNQLDQIISSLINSKGWKASHILIICPWFLDSVGYSFMASGGALNANDANHKMYIKAAKDISDKWNTMYYNGYDVVASNGGDILLEPDGIHPKDSGHKVMAHGLLKYLNGVGFTGNLHVDSVSSDRYVESGFGNFPSGNGGFNKTFQSNVQGQSGVSFSGNFSWHTSPNGSLNKDNFLLQLRSYDAGSNSENNVLTINGVGNANFLGRVSAPSLKTAGLILDSGSPTGYILTPNISDRKSIDICVEGGGDLDQLRILSTKVLFDGNTILGDVSKVDNGTKLQIYGGIYLKELEGVGERPIVANADGTIKAGELNPRVVNIHEGDSITDTNPDTGGYVTNYPNILDTLSSFFKTNTKINVAKAGDTIAQYLSENEYQNQIYQYRPLKSNDISNLFFRFGINDLVVRTPEQVYADLKTAWAQAKADGFYVFAHTITPIVNEGINAKAYLLNDLIRSDRSLYYRLVDLGSAFSKINPSDPNYYYPDGVHPNYGGSLIYAKEVLNTINRTTYGDLISSSVVGLNDGSNLNNNITGSAQRWSNKDADFTKFGTGSIAWMVAQDSQGLVTAWEAPAINDFLALNLQKVSDRGNATTQNIRANGFTSNNLEGLRIIGDAGYISGFNSDQTVRNGYLQFNGLNTAIQTRDNNPILLNAVNGNILLGSETDDGLHKLQVNGNSIIRGDLLIENLEGTGNRPVSAAPDGRLIIGIPFVETDTLQSVVNRGSGVTGKIQVGTAPTNPTDVVRLTDLGNYATLQGNTFTGRQNMPSFSVVNGVRDTLNTGLTSSGNFEKGSLLFHSYNTSNANDFYASLSASNAMTQSIFVQLPPIGGTLATTNDISSATGVTVNSSASTLALNSRGYYNYIGSGATAWSLPSVVGIEGRFYRIYNKAADVISAITITPNGTDKFFQGGVRLSSIDLQYGENLTLVSDGIDWNIYG